MGAFHVTISWRNTYSERCYMAGAQGHQKPYNVPQRHHKDRYRCSSCHYHLYDLKIAIAAGRAKRISIKALSGYILAIRPYIRTD